MMSSSRRERSDLSLLRLYFGRIREFGSRDWLVYTAWVGLMVGLVGATGGFLLFGHAHGVRYPAVAWLVPIGAAIFTLAIAVDTIGHRTIYKEVLESGERMVHAVTIFCGVSSCVLLCAAFRHRDAFWIPAMVLTALSVLYSLIDEAFHWRRYVMQKSDPIEMWSHVFILVGHSTMMLAWWVWFFRGYPGVEQTVAFLSSTSR